ncbi:MAG: Asp-tRNA(Asn)/Glu-tRNA(Gln) amidotransferase subunit GatA [Erysipelotrichia bacterium]|nr:Asp-tRNA(Asn)/Glu-tRNA(Gln) amidotransferase subunit GatA [Erysipelotrichia bacterium]
MRDYLSLSLTELHEALVNKEVTPKVLVKQALAKIKADNNNAFEYICETEALLMAEELSAQQPEKDNIFWGIPYALKDNFSTKDILTTASSRLLADYIPVFSAEIYRRLKKAKAIMVAKTTLDELAMNDTGSSGHKGKTFNPWDETQTRMIGGSSCGSAACCARGIVPFALGSDTGDSVRKPASYGGLVGFKPTWGLISRYGLFPFANSLDTVAYFTRNVTDCAHLLNLLAGHDFKDMTTSKRPVVNYVEKLKAKKPHVLVVIDEIVEAIEDRFIKETFNEHLKQLTRRGFVIKHVSIDQKLLEAIYPTYYIISSAEATSNNANLDGIKFGTQQGGDSYEEMLFKVRNHGFSNRIKRRFVIGGLALLEENQQDIYLLAAKSRHLIVKAFKDVLAKCDAIILPASPTVAKSFSDLVPTKTYDQNASIAESHLSVGNLGGFPSITLPLGFKDNLPFGVNITGEIFTDDKVLSVAKAIEDVTGLKDLIAGVNK